MSPHLWQWSRVCTDGELALQCERASIDRALRLVLDRDDDRQGFAVREADARHANRRGDGPRAEPVATEVTRNMDGTRRSDGGEAEWVGRERKDGLEDERNGRRQQVRRREAGQVTDAFDLERDGQEREMSMRASLACAETLVDQGPLDSPHTRLRPLPCASSDAASRCSCPPPPADVRTCLRP